MAIVPSSPRPLFSLLRVPAHKYPARMVKTMFSLTTCLRRIPRDTGCFMDLDAYAMACTVAEEFAISRFSDKTSSRFVYLFRLHSRSDAGNSFHVCFDHGPINRFFLTDSPVSFNEESSSSYRNNTRWPLRPSLRLRGPPCSISFRSVAREAWLNSDLTQG